MKKLSLRLELEALAVETFDPVGTGARGAAGTVHGHAIYPQNPNYPVSPLCMDTPLASCDGSCRDTCAESCWGTCQSCAASCNGADTCWGSCGGTCEASCADTCRQSCGPLCVPPDQVALNHNFAR